jgi:hypothetical protein
MIYGISFFAFFLRFTFIFTHTECPINLTKSTLMVTVNQINNTTTTLRPSLFRELISSQYQNYSMAFLLTILIGCCLLTLNVLIFCAIYYQRGKRKKYANRKKIISNNIDNQSAVSPSQSQNREKRLQMINQKANTNRIESRRCPTHEKQLLEITNCNDKSHQSNNALHLSSRQSKRSAPYDRNNPEGSNHEIHKIVDMRSSHNSLMECEGMSDIPDPPPPPRSRTPKKRVQIQEISV